MLGDRHEDHGAAAVEFALIALVLVTMLVGIMEFGRLWAIQGNLAQATRDAARTYAITSDASTAAPVVKAGFTWVSPETMGSLSVNTSSSNDEDPGDPDCRRIVVSNYRVESLTGFLGDGWDIAVEGSMRCNG